MGETHYWIYALKDPRDHTVRYVGYSKNPEKRYGQHLLLIDKSRDKNEWIQELFSLHLLPELTLIDTAEIKVEAERKEAEWIQQYLRDGELLTNGVIPVPKIVTEEDYVTEKRLSREDEIVLDVIERAPRRSTMEECIEMSGLERRRFFQSLERLVRKRYVSGEFPIGFRRTKKPYTW